LTKTRKSQTGSATVQQNDWWNLVELYDAVIDKS